MSDVAWRLDGVLLDLLLEAGCDLERVEVGAYVVALPGVRRSRTLVWLIAGERAVHVEAFVLHLIDVVEPGRLHRHLLRCNLGLRRVHFAVDDVGDLFLVGSLPPACLDADLLDAVLGEVLQLLEDQTPALLALAYGDRLGGDEALAAKVLADGAGRRPAGTPDGAPRRDGRR